jgi:hypothetical protein
MQEGNPPSRYELDNSVSYENPTDERSTHRNPAAMLMPPASHLLLHHGRPVMHFPPTMMMPHHMAAWHRPFYQ